MSRENNSTPNGHSTGADAGFEALLQKHERAVFRLAWGVLRDLHAAEDVAQEALLRLWQEYQKHAFTTSCDGWLRTVVLNLSCDRLRREGNFKGHAPVKENELVSSTRTADAVAETSEDAIRLRARIDALPRQQRRSILLVFGEGLSFHETALLMDCSTKTVRNHIQAARESLHSHKM